MKLTKEMVDDIVCDILDTYEDGFGLDEVLTEFIMLIINDNVDGLNKFLKDYNIRDDE